MWIRVDTNLFICTALKEFVGGLLRHHQLAFQEIIVNFEVSVKSYSILWNFLFCSVLKDLHSLVPECLPVLLHPVGAGPAIMTQCHNANASQVLHFFLSLSLIVELEDARLHADEEEAKDSSRETGSSPFCISTLFEGSFKQRYCDHIHFRCSPGSRCCRWCNKSELGRRRTGWIGKGEWGWNKPVRCKSVNKGWCYDETNEKGSPGQCQVCEW